MYGHAPLHSAPRREQKHHALQRGATLSGNGVSRLHMCVYVCMFLHSLRSYKEMTCCGDEMRVGNTGKQNTNQTSWHFCSQNTNLGWQYQMNPDMHRPPPSSTSRPVNRQHHLADYSLLLALCCSLSLTSWQPALATRTRTLPFLARCLHWHLTAATDDQMGFWENIQQLFLHGILS